MMEKFRAVVFKVASSDPYRTMTPERISQIESRLADFPLPLSVPSHPPYPAMIIRAITELEDEEGTSEEAISRFIKSEYNSLPWAHSRYLSHHLSKLCENGEIVSTRGGLYLIQNTSPDIPCRPRKKGRKRIKQKAGKEGVEVYNLEVPKEDKEPTLDMVVLPEDQEKIDQKQADEVLEEGNYEERDVGLPALNSTVGLNLHIPVLALPEPVAQLKIEQSLAYEGILEEKPLEISGVSDLVHKNVEEEDELDVHGREMYCKHGLEENQSRFHPRPAQVVDMENQCGHVNIAELLDSGSLLEKKFLEVRRVSDFSDKSFGEGDRKMNCKNVLEGNEPGFHQPVQGADTENQCDQAELTESFAYESIIEEEHLDFRTVSDLALKIVEEWVQPDVHGHEMDCENLLEENQLALHSQPLQVADMENQYDPVKLTESLDSGSLLEEKPLEIRTFKDLMHKNVEEGVHPDVCGHEMDCESDLEGNQLVFHPQPVQVADVENQCDCVKITESSDFGILLEEEPMEIRAVSNLVHKNVEQWAKSGAHGHEMDCETVLEENHLRFHPKPVELPDMKNQRDPVKITESLSSKGLNQEKPLEVKTLSNLVHNNVGERDESDIHSHEMKCESVLEDNQLGFHLQPVQIEHDVVPALNSTTGFNLLKPMLALSDPADQVQIEQSLAYEDILEEKPLGICGVSDLMHKNVEEGDELDVRGHEMYGKNGLEENHLGFHPHLILMADMKNQCDPVNVSESLASGSLLDEKSLEVRKVSDLVHNSVEKRNLTDVHGRHLNCENVFEENEPGFHPQPVQVALMENQHHHVKITDSLASGSLLEEGPLEIRTVSDLLYKNSEEGVQSDVHGHEMDCENVLGANQLGFHRKQVELPDMENQCDSAKINESLGSRGLIQEKHLEVRAVNNLVHKNVEEMDESGVHGQETNCKNRLEENQLGFHPQLVQVTDMESQCDPVKVTESLSSKGLIEEKPLEVRTGSDLVHKDVEEGVQSVVHDHETNCENGFEDRLVFHSQSVEVPDVENQCHPVKITELLASGCLPEGKHLDVGRVGDLALKSVEEGDQSDVFGCEMNCKIGLEENQLELHPQPMQVTEMETNCHPVKIIENELQILGGPLGSESMDVRWSGHGRSPKQQPVEDEVLLLDSSGSKKREPVLKKNNCDPLKIAENELQILDGPLGSESVILPGRRGRGRPPKQQPVEDEVLSLNSPGSKNWQHVLKKNNCDHVKIIEDEIQILDGPLGSESMVAPRRRGRGRPPKQQPVEEEVLLLDSPGSKDHQPTLKRGRGIPSQPRRGRSSMRM